MSASSDDRLRCGPSLWDQLSGPTREELQRAGLLSAGPAQDYSVGNLIRHDARQLRKRFGLSAQAVDELSAFLKTRGLKLGFKDEDWPPPPFRKTA